MQLKPLNQQVIVITGASSGIGLCTAQMAARQGARVVLAARNLAMLNKIKRDIEADGGQALAVETDVTRAADLENLAERALARFGTIDTWVNNAGVSIFGPMELVSERDHRALFETNFWGIVNGSMIASQILRRHGGALINLGSVVSDRTFPLQGMYCASKHAVKGFTDALRMELEHSQAPVSVTLIKPAAIATPFMEHAKNYTEHEFQLPPPLYAPEEVAKAILEAAVQPTRDILVGDAAPVMSAVAGLMPRVFDRISEAGLFGLQKKNRPVEHTGDNLHGPMSEGRTRAEHPGYPAQPSVYNAARRNPGLAGAAVAVAGFAALAAWRRSLPKAAPALDEVKVPAPTLTEAIAATPAMRL